MRTLERKAASASSAKWILEVALVACIVATLSGCSGAEHVVSKDYRLCADMPSGAEVSYTTSEDHEAAVAHVGGATIRIGVSSRPTAPAMLIVQYHPLIRNGGDVSSDTATRLVDIYEQDKLQALSVIGTGVVGRKLYVEAFADASDGPTVSKILATVRKCSK